MNRLLTQLGIGWLSVMAASCVASLAPLKPTMVPRPVEFCSAACSDSAELTYLGSGGFLIRHGADAILTSASFTHHGFLRTFLPGFPISTDTNLVLWMMARERLDGVKALLVGHSHYDHLLDAPYVAERIVPNADLYGGPTMKNTLWGDAALRTRLHALAGDDVGNATTPGTWIQPQGSRIRFMAFESSHAPTVFLFFGKHWPYTFSSSGYAEPRNDLPRTPRGWHMGETYAYLIDVLDTNGRPVLRIFYEDSAADPAFTSLPPSLLADRGIDIAIICAGNFGNARDYPSSLLRQLRPKYAIVGHWEDFFRSPVPPFSSIRNNGVGELAKRVQLGVDSNWVTPEPRARIVVRF